MYWYNVAVTIVNIDGIACDDSTGVGGRVPANGDTIGVIEGSGYITWGCVRRWSGRGQVKL